MWTIDDFSNLYLLFTRNYGTDSSVNFQISDNEGVTWATYNNFAISPQDLGIQPTGTWLRLKSASDNTLSNIWIV